MRRRKRTAAITLVLAGTVSGCGETLPQQDVYQSLGRCQQDWNGPEQCQPVRDGRYHQSWYYGPAYYGERWPSGLPRASAGAVEARRLDKQTQVASAPRSYWSSSRSYSSGGSSSTISRGGFGSSSRSSSS